METHVCPSSKYPFFDLGIRKLIHNPKKLFSKYVKAGDRAADIGCGPGFFTIGLAGLVGESGCVYGIDVQDEAFERIRKKVKGTRYENTVRTHKSNFDSIGLDEKFDFILCFWMLHEVEDKAKFINEVRGMMNPDAKFMLVEPNMHINKDIFEQELTIINNAGFIEIENPKVCLGKTAVYKLK